MALQPDKECPHSGFWPASHPFVVRCGCRWSIVLLQKTAIRLMHKEAKRDKRFCFSYHQVCCKISHRIAFQRKKYTTFGHSSLLAKPSHKDEAIILPNNQYRNFVASDSPGIELSGRRMDGCERNPPACCSRFHFLPCLSKRLR